MSRLDLARRRLELAVARLERALQRTQARHAERAELAAALEAARAEGKEMRALGATLAARLDRLIGELKGSLGS